MTDKLSFSSKVELFYSGRRFSKKEFWLKPFIDFLGDGFIVNEPRYTPLEGAVMLVLNNKK